MNNKVLESLRQDYRAKTLDIVDVSNNPFEQFKVWFEEAMNSKLLEPNAMTLATATKDGIPSARIVLLKGFDDNGFVFYTNYESKKGQQLAENPNAALVFNWLELQRQIRIEGIVRKMPEADSTAYFQVRPKGSQIGAHASPQSSVIENRTFLEERYKSLTEEYEAVQTLPKPDFWGGYILEPTLIEFWQGRTSRLHDRVEYKKQDGDWKINRLAP